MGCGGIWCGGINSDVGVVGLAYTYTKPSDWGRLICKLINPPKGLPTMRNLGIFDKLLYKKDEVQHMTGASTYRVCNFVSCPTLGTTPVSELLCISLQQMDKHTYVIKPFQHKFSNCTIKTSAYK